MITKELKKEAQERKKRKWEIQRRLWAGDLSFESGALKCAVCGTSLIQVKGEIKDEEVIKTVESHSCRMPMLVRIFERWRDLGDFGKLFWKRDGPRSSLIVGSRHPLAFYLKKAAAGLGLHGRITVYGDPAKICSMIRVLTTNIPNCEGDPATGEIWAPEKLK